MLFFTERITPQMNLIHPIHGLLMLVDTLFRAKQEHLQKTYNHENQIDIYTYKRKNRSVSSIELNQEIKKFCPGPTIFSAENQIICYNGKIYRWIKTPIKKQSDEESLQGSERKPSSQDI